MKKLRITVDGRVFDVTVELPEESAAPSAAPRAVASSAPAASIPSSSPARSAGAAGPGVICSPLAGKIVSIDVTMGAAVAAGAQVATIEAMKMNTFVFADKAGKVTAIAGKAGDSVEEGGALLTIA